MGDATHLRLGTQVSRAGYSAVFSLAYGDAKKVGLRLVASFLLPVALLAVAALAVFQPAYFPDSLPAFLRLLPSIVLAIGVLTGAYMVKYPKLATSDLEPLIGGVQADSPAAKAGILPGDKVQVELSPYDLARGRITYRYK
jgi:membrane-associated protease RseP (regulator of RpoE activity)